VVYGLGSRSYNRSAENRENKRQVAAATAAYLAIPHEAVEIRWSMCTCRSFRLPHDPVEHSKGPMRLRSDMDWRTWQQRGI
jgi:hypothetical protein